MSLCTNLFRRGAVYWWRRRFASPESKNSKIIALSTKTREPKAARLVAARLNAKAVRIDRLLGLRMLSLVDAREQLAIVTADGLQFDVADHVLRDASNYEQNQRNARAAINALPEAFSPAQRDLILAKLISEDHQRFGSDLLRGYCFAEADEQGRLRGEAGTRAEAIMAQVYRRIALGGAQTKITGVDRENLAKANFSAVEIDTIDALVGDVAPYETWTDWRLGWAKSELSDLLVSAGVRPTLTNIQSLRRAALFMRAEVLDEISDECAAVNPKKYYQMLRSGSVMPSPAEKTPAATPVLPPEPQEEILTQTIVEAVVADAVVESGSSKILCDDASKHSLILQVENLIALHKKTWTEKTKRQHRSIAKLFVKFVAADDPRQLTQENVGGFRQILTRLPKNHGKSSKDKHRTLAEIIAIGEAKQRAAEEAEARAAENNPSRHSKTVELIGLDAGTVNRYITQLCNIMNHCDANGYIIGKPETLAKQRPKDDIRIMQFIEANA